MGKELQRIVRELKENWRWYIFQSFLAGVVLLLAMLIINIWVNPVIVASIGATSFIVFTMPGEITSRPRNIIGGHIIGLLVGIMMSRLAKETNIAPVFSYSSAVGLSIFLMVALDFEHPPASGTALAFAMEPYSKETISAFLTTIIIITVAGFLLRKKLRNLI